MARKPNYDFERRERERLKAIKVAEKAEAARRARAHPAGRGRRARRRRRRLWRPTRPPRVFPREVNAMEGMVAGEHDSSVRFADTSPFEWGGKSTALMRLLPIQMGEVSPSYGDGGVTPQPARAFRRCPRASP